MLIPASVNMIDLQEENFLLAATGARLAVVTQAGEPDLPKSASEVGTTAGTSLLVTIALAPATGASSLRPSLAVRPVLVALPPVLASQAGRRPFLPRRLDPAGFADAGRAATLPHPSYILRHLVQARATIFQPFRRLLTASRAPAGGDPLFPELLHLRRVASQAIATKFAS